MIRYLGLFRWAITRDISATYQAVVIPPMLIHNFRALSAGYTQILTKEAARQNAGACIVYEALLALTLSLNPKP